MELFPSIHLSDTEQDIIREKLADPAVQKYLRFLGHSIALNILTADPAHKSAEEHLRLVARAQGQLECLETLASAFSSTSST